VDECKPRLHGEKGLQQDHENAAGWFRKAADLGHMDAAINLSRCYYTGRGVEQNYELAVAWLFKATEQGLDMSQLTVLGKASVKKDLPLEKRSLQVSAAQGNEDAVTLLKLMSEAEVEAAAVVLSGVVVAVGFVVAVAVVAVAVAKAVAVAVAVAVVLTALGRRHDFGGGGTVAVAVAVALAALMATSDG